MGWDAEGLYYIRLRVRCPELNLVSRGTGKGKGREKRKIIGSQEGRIKK